MTILLQQLGLCLFYYPLVYNFYKTLPSKQIISMHIIHKNYSFYTKLFLFQTFLFIYILFIGVQTPVCAISGAQFLTESGWIDLRSPIDADVPFKLFRDEGRTFLQVVL